MRRRSFGFSSLLFVSSVVLVVAAAACSDSAGQAKSGAGPGPAEVEASTGVEVELVESAPVETTLDNADVRDAYEVWPEMIDRAQATLDLEQFYASENEYYPAGSPVPDTRLTRVIEAIGRAVTRGVTVRFLADASLATSAYPRSLQRMKDVGAVVRTIDGASRFGDAQHAKFMVVDGEEAFVGSQNFDWRSLEHIQEMGLRLRSPAVAGALLDIFETDWALARSSTPDDARTHDHADVPEAQARTGESVALYASPKGWLPDETRRELDRVVELLDGARASIGLHVLTYSTVGFKTLDDALRRAAARGVHVQLLVSDWGAVPDGGLRQSIEALLDVSNVEVRVLTVPPFSGGEIEYARVSHAKFLVVDGETAWVGTSNWEGTYFLAMRNVALVLSGGAIPGRLTKIFADDWASTYAAKLERQTP